MLRLHRALPATTPNKVPMTQQYRRQYRPINNTQDSTDESTIPTTVSTAQQYRRQYRRLINTEDDTEDSTDESTIPGDGTDESIIPKTAPTNQRHRQLMKTQYSAHRAGHHHCQLCIIPLHLSSFSFLPTSCKSSHKKAKKETPTIDQQTNTTKTKIN